MASVAAPGSLLWLLGHDIRLSWRDARAGLRGLGSRSLLVLLGLIAVGAHLAAWPIAAEFAWRSESAPFSPGLEAQAGAVVAFVMLLMLAQTLNGTTRLLYSRGDLDLLLSSPLSSRRIFMVRSLAVAVGALTSAGLFIVPLADAGLLTGHPRFLALYPTLLGGALLASAAAVLVAFVLFQLIGPRATRLAAQILATLLGAGFMLGLQLQRLLPSVSGAAVVDAIRTWPFGLDGLVLLPVRAGLGRPGPLLAWMVASVAVFVLVTWTLGGRLAASLQAVASKTASGTGPSRRAVGRTAEFRAAPSVLAALRRKEHQLILRDPWIVSQVLLQVLYMTPMAILLWSGAGSATLALAPMIVVIAFQVASSLTWLSLSGEDAPELLATAPVPENVLRRGKLEAVAGLTAIIVALPLGWLAVLAPATAAVALGLAMLGVGNAVLLQLWRGRPGRRSAFAARHRESKLLAMIEMALSILWGIGTALTILPSRWALVPVCAIALVMLCCRPAAASRD